MKLMIWIDISNLIIIIICSVIIATKTTSKNRKLNCKILFPLNKFNSKQLLQLHHKLRLQVKRSFIEEENWLNGLDLKIKFKISNKLLLITRSNNRNKKNLHLKKKRFLL